MLTQEQIDNLKEGDPIVIHTTFDHIESDGDVMFLAPYSCGDDCLAYINLKYVSLPSEPGTSVPTPKYDPTRLFKKGDKVKPAERHGRKTTKLNYTAEYTVTSSEDDYGTVGVEYFNGEMPVSVSVPFYWLELVTPVEELEPYKLIDSPNTYNIVRDSAMVMTIHKKSHPHAKAAAEAECKRLNEEWRKEQNND